jgi:tetratricopeptide (TPR) repeat protein
MTNITRYIYLLILFVSLPGLHAFAGGVGSDQLLWEANQLFKEFKDAEALEKFEQLIKEQPNHQEALCKASVLSTRIGGRFEDDTRKGHYFEKALLLSSRAIGVDSTKAEANYVRALALGSMSQVSGFKDRLLYLVTSKRYIDRTLAIDDKHAGAWHLQGRWSYKVANLTIAEKAASKFLMSSGPLPIASNQDALSAISKAIDLDPSNLLYYFDLARVQKEVDLKSECIETLQKALDQKLVTTEDLELSRRCKLLLQQVLKV